MNTKEIIEQLITGEIISPNDTRYDFEVYKQENYKQ